MYLYDYVIKQCKQLSDTGSTTILRGVIFALGHLARNFGKIDAHVLDDVVQKALELNDTITIDPASNVRSDIKGLVKRYSRKFILKE